MMETFRDGIIAEVTGTVARVFTYAKGDASVIEYPIKGLEYPERVTVWGAKLVQGAKVTARGRLAISKKVDPDNGKTYVNLGLNDAVILNDTPTPTHDGWADDGEEPF